MRTDIHEGSRILAPDTTPQGYGPAALRSAYRLPQGSAGNGHLVALVDAYNDPNAASDLAVYRRQYGLPACTTANGCFTKVNQSGRPSGYPAADPDWAAEESLDLDMVSAACPNCRILLIEANSSYATDLGASVDEAVKLGARYVSNSYGAPEVPGEASFDAYYDHSGVAVTVSAGDSGYGVEWPAASPYVVAVGGTSLLPASNPRGWDEITWTGTGSGCSQIEFKPRWQANRNCPDRTNNDVAAVADPETGVAIYDTYDTQALRLKPGWQVFGGTSASSPIIASIYALAGIPATGDPADAVYVHHTRLFDIDAGTNDLYGNCKPTYLCNAQRGYDGPTGWGTPNGVAGFVPTANSGP